ncbi:MAG: hypothetical protein LUF92_11500, partial [Clostridiales bacterium]|nr:hypothetical protein [Clostridiales bacterium]
MRIYIRFWNIFEEDMHLNKSSKTGQFNYGRLDEVLDFLVGQKLCPYIELRSRTFRLLQTANKVVQEKEHARSFGKKEDFAAFFWDFFTHLLRRYGHMEVSTWIFSYSIENDTKFEKGFLEFNMLDEQTWQTYLEEFDIVDEILKKRIPNAKIGGPGFSVQHYNAEGMKRLLQVWKMEHHCPDFISITSFPYQIVQDNGNWYEQRRTDFNFVKEDVEMIK